MVLVPYPFPLISAPRPPLSPFLACVRPHHRYKATSENDGSLPCNGDIGFSRPRLVMTSDPPLPPATKKLRSSPSVSSLESASRKINSAASGSFAAPGNNAAAGVASKISPAPGSPYPSSTPPPLPSSGEAPPTTATEVAAREIALSLTPTALSWALVSLLADGGTGGGGSSGDGGSFVGRAGGRGQGHLLPRSRDKYPTSVRAALGQRQGGNWELTLLRK